MAGVSYRARLADFGLAESFDAAADAATDMTVLMDKIGSVLITGAQERIGTSNVDPDGTPWPKSLRATINGGPTLHDSGQLMRSITSFAEPREVTVGSNIISAGVHQAGAVITAKDGGALAFTLANGETAVVGSVTIPARPYLGISTVEGERISEVSAGHFAGFLGTEAN